MTADAALFETLSRLQPLAALGPDSLRELAPRCGRELVPRSRDRRPFGGRRGQLVYLAKGELKVDLADGSSTLLVGGWGDALFPLGYRGHGVVASRAITDVELLRLDEELLDIVCTWRQLAMGCEEAGAGTDWRTLAGIFAAQSFVDGVFAALPAANIDALLGRFRRSEMRRGDVVVREGDIGYFYYVIDRGRCRVTREVGGATTELAELKGGDAFGEEALLADGKRNATVTMQTDGVLLRLDKADFVSLLKEPLLHRLAAAEAARRVATGAVWLDTRFPAEYRHDGLPGAINIPLNELRQAMNMLDKRQEYVVYCQSGRRSSAAAFLLSQKGFRASLVDGGLKALRAGSEAK